MVFGACPGLSFTSPPSSQWVGPGEPLQGAAYAVQKAAVFPPRKKKRLLQPLLPAKLRFPLLAISNSKAVFVAKLLPLPLNPGNSDVGGGWFLILPSNHPVQELPSPLCLPSFKVSHTAKQNRADPGRDQRTQGGRERKGKKIQADGLSSLVSMEKSASRMLSKPVNTPKPNESKTCFRN